MNKKIFHILAFFMVLVMSPVLSQAQDSGEAFKSTPYPVPRFVSLGVDKVHVRSGPGQRYPIEWVYEKRGLPVEIILEYETWRKIKDSEGQVGWLHGSLLSGKRTGLIRSDDLVTLYQKPDAESRPVAQAEPKALVNISECGNDWCKIDASGYGGWVKQVFIWGVYDKESFD